MAYVGYGVISWLRDWRGFVVMYLRCMYACMHMYVCVYDVWMHVCIYVIKPASLIIRIYVPHTRFLNLLLSSTHTLTIFLFRAVVLTLPEKHWLTSGC